jgi:UDP-N-acetylmuramoyl-L-alanyl-D-glutamate--2,6-diaminopimelate ligase
MTSICMPSTFPVTAHTDYVGAGSCFVAIPGCHQHGAVYIPVALQKGATSVVIEEREELSAELMGLIAVHQAKLIRVPHARRALASLSAQAAGYPAHKLRIIGITGTKGKTTSTYLLEHILRSAGLRTARISGIKNSINGHELQPSLTTPQPDYLHQFFALCVQQGVTHVVMEVAAQGLTFDRLVTVQLNGVLFTNIAHEHFELYKDMDDYFSHKMRIFSHIEPTSYCLVNGDDSYAATIPALYPQVHTFGFRAPATLPVVSLAASDGIGICIGQDEYKCPSLLGHYNEENLAGAVLMARHYGVRPAVINNALASFCPLPGRMERYALPNGATAIIDYAHNPSSYQALLSTLRARTDHLIVLFGASGTKGKDKRPLMGAIAAQYADIVIISSDNPGPVDPEIIIEDIAQGIDPAQMHKVKKNADRAQAITLAYALSQPGSIIALLGKGVDEYQSIKGVKYHFSERELLQRLT